MAAITSAGVRPGSGASAVGARRRARGRVSRTRRCDPTPPCTAGRSLRVVGRVAVHRVGHETATQVDPALHLGVARHLIAVVAGVAAVIWSPSPSSGRVTVLLVAVWTVSPSAGLATQGTPARHDLARAARVFELGEAVELQRDVGGGAVVPR